MANAVASEEIAQWAPRPTTEKFKEWATQHGIALPARGRIPAETWAKWDEWYLAETADARKKLIAAHGRIGKAFQAETIEAREVYSAAMAAYEEVTAPADAKARKAFDRAHKAFTSATEHVHGFLDASGDSFTAA